MPEDHPTVFATGGRLMPEDDWFYNRYSGPTVYVFATGLKSIPKDIREVVDGRIRIQHINDPRAYPGHMDFYVQHAGLTAKAERAAAMMHAQIVVMPEGANWLANRIRELVEKGPVWLYVPSKTGDYI